MTTPTTHKSPKTRVPSRRDQDIYTRVVVRCELQQDVAKDLGLSAGRISQILSRIRRWLATGVTASVRQSAIRNPQSAIDSDAAFSALEQQRLQRHLAQARHEISVRSIKQMSENPKHTTVRTESKPADDESLTPDSRPLTPCKIVTTVRDQPLNVQFIKTAQRSTIELQKLAELDPLPPPEVSAAEDRRGLAEDLVTDLMENAVFADKIRSLGDERLFVEDLFKFLLGERHRGVATNIIAADAKHGRLRPDDRAYPGHDPMLAVSESSVPGSSLGPHEPEAPASANVDDPSADALKNTKPHTATANQPHNQNQTEPRAANPGPAATSNQRTVLRPAVTASAAPPQKTHNFSAAPPPQSTIRLTCPVVINPP